MIGNFSGEFRLPNHGMRLHESASSTHLSRLPTLMFWCVSHYMAEFRIKVRNSGVSSNSLKVWNPQYYHRTVQNQQLPAAWSPDIYILCTHRGRGDIFVLLVFLAKSGTRSVEQCSTLQRTQQCLDHSDCQVAFPLFELRKSVWHSSLETWPSYITSIRAYITSSTNFKHPESHIWYDGVRHETT